MKIAKVTVTSYPEVEQYRVYFDDPVEVRLTDHIVFVRVSGVSTAEDAKTFIDDFGDSCRQFGLPAPIAQRMIEQVDRYLTGPAA